MSFQYLIAGAGYTGARLAQRLLHDGQSVALIRRQPLNQPNATALAIDLDDADDLKQLLHGALTGQPLRIAYLVPPNAAPGTLEDPRLARLLAALPIIPERLVLASTTGVYGDHAGRSVDEATPLRASTARARARVALERTLIDWATAHAMSYCVLRIAGIYGPGRLPLAAIKKQAPIIDPAEAGPGNRIHVDDLVETFCQALDQPAPPTMVNVSDGDHTSTSDFTLKVASMAGLPPPPSISLARAQKTFSAMRLSFINESRRLNNRVLTEQLGVKLRYISHADGIAASLQDSDY